MRDKDTKVIEKEICSRLFTSYFKSIIHLAKVLINLFPFRSLSLQIVSSLLKVMPIMTH